MEPVLQDRRFPAPRRPPACTGRRPHPAAWTPGYVPHRDPGICVFSPWCWRPHLRAHRRRSGTRSPWQTLPGSVNSQRLRLSYRCLERTIWKLTASRETQHVFTQTVQEAGHKPGTLCLGCRAGGGRSLCHLGRVKQEVARPSEGHLGSRLLPPGTARRCTAAAGELPLTPGTRGGPVPGALGEPCPHACPSNAGGRISVSRGVS